MGFGFLAPLFLGAALLVGIPWLIHKIRRPERDTLRFSSLMFVPRIKKEIIERRKIQHLLLLLLRMLLFLLLALAFSRPAYRSERAAAVFERAKGFHLILLDTSYSMGVSDRWGEARRAAESVLDGLPADAAVGLVSFADQPRVAVPLGEGSSGVDAKDAVRKALDGLSPGQNGTRFLPALQLASQLLFAAAPVEENRAPNLNLHLISDFQRRGLPGPDSSWKLSGLVQLIAHPVSGEAPDNLAVDEVQVRGDVGSRPVLAAKIKNWTPRPAEAVVRMHLAGGGADGPSEPQTIRLEPGNAGTLSFPLGERPGPVAGWLTLEADAVAVDNIGYFSWRPAQKRELFLLSGEGENAAYSASWFLRRALADSGPPSWNVSDGAPSEWGGVAEPQAAAIETVVAVGLSGGEGADLAVLTDWVARGGRLLICLEPEVRSKAVADLLARLGWRAEGPRFEQSLETSFDILARLDFEHPVFRPFQSSRFNDFSQIRFFNYAKLVPHSPSPESAPRHEVLAEFSSTGPAGAFPAMIEASLGEGKALVWTFAPDLATGNFPKNIKFLPVLHESVDYLLGPKSEVTALRVGDSWRAVSGGEARAPTLQLMTADDRAWQEFDAGNGRAADLPGLVRVPAGQGADARVYAVNLDARESDPEIVDPAEFGLRLTSTGGSDPEAPLATASPGGRLETDVREYGARLLPLVFLLLLFEIWLAARLTRSGKRETAGTPA